MVSIAEKILLLNEPFGALDARVRQELRRWLRRLHDEIGITSVFVTHDQAEALELADCVVLREGHIEQIGTPEGVYECPATPFVYRFLGNVNLFRGRMEGGSIHIGECTVEFPAGAPPEDTPAMMFAHHLEDSGEYCVFTHPTPAMVFARPHHLGIDHQPTGRAQFAHQRGLYQPHHRPSRGLPGSRRPNPCGESAPGTPDQKAGSRATGGEP
jgi:ABC-type sulfate/molybdate transport systems ATPase subunit